RASGASFIPVAMGRARPALDAMTSAVPRSCRGPRWVEAHTPGLDGRAALRGESSGERVLPAQRLLESRRDRLREACGVASVAVPVLEAPRLASGHEDISPDRIRKRATARRDGAQQ